MNYPNPCDACEKAGSCTVGCAAWKVRYRYRQKQINAYHKQLMRPRGGSEMQVFRYEHPDIIRRYLEKGPCEGCKAEEVCDTPCPAYLGWWDARMGWIRGRLGL